MKAGGITQEITTAIKLGKAPDSMWFRFRREPCDEVLGGFPHDFRERPVLPFGDLFEPFVERIRKLNLGARHDAYHTSTLF